MPSDTFTITSEQAGATLAAVLRSRLAGPSWTEVRRLVASRHVRVLGELCLDPARRLKEGDTVEVMNRPSAMPRPHVDVVIRYLDTQVVVVEKPSGTSSVRHPTEREWTERRKRLHPTMEDIVPFLIAQRERKGVKASMPRLRVVHRLDKETSGLLVFARTADAERALGMQFRRHTVLRRYLAVVPGTMEARRIESYLVRDRGDGRRGSGPNPEAGKRAVTHVEVEERLAGYTLVSCRLETGRTHQIRIHLAEAGHPLCGEQVYNRRPGGPPVPDPSGAPRLALHATELGFIHPTAGDAMHWTMPLPPDLEAFLARLRDKGAAHGH